MVRFSKLQVCWLFVGWFLILGWKAFGQSTVIISPPTLQSVSISPDDGLVTAKWSPSSTPGIDGYLIYKYESGSAAGGYESWKVADMAATQFTFSFDTVNTRAVPFLVVAYQEVSGILNKSVYTSIHTTNYLTLAYDSCSATISLTWTGYQGWSSALSGYRVFQYDNGVSTDISGLLSSSQLSYVVQSIKGGTDYCFYIQAENSTGLDPVHSNKVCRHTYLEKNPSYFYAANANVVQNSRAELLFLIDSSTSIVQFELESSVASGGAFTSIQSFNLSKPQSISTIDSAGFSLPKYYRLVGINSCKQVAVTSNLSTAMNLTCQVADNKAHLTWTAYKDFINWNSQYRIYRWLSNQGAQMIGTTDGNTATFDDDILSLAGLSNVDEVCYQVEAVSDPHPDGNTYTCLSAYGCVDLSQFVFVPEAFTPNGDGQNEVFTPYFISPPSSFHLWVYNKLGALLFETSDYTRGWNGKLSNGKEADESVYVYFFTYINSQGKTFEKKGTLTLIYP